MRLSELSATLTIGGKLALIPHFGLVGAAVGNACACVVCALSATAAGNWFDRSRSEHWARRVLRLRRQPPRVLYPVR